MDDEFGMKNERAEYFDLLNKKTSICDDCISKILEYNFQLIIKLCVYEIIFERGCIGEVKC